MCGCSINTMVISFIAVAIIIIVPSIRAQLLGDYSHRSRLQSPWESQRLPRSSSECMLILYDFGDLTGPQLVQTTNDIDSTLVGDGWNDRVSSIQVNGGCQWILYEHPWTVWDGISSVIGPGPRTYLNGTFGIPDNSLSSIRCLPASGTQAIMLFVHHKYFGGMLVVNSSYANLARANFDNTVSSFIVTGGTWQLYSDINYQGRSITHGVGIYPAVSFLGPISNDDLSSVKLVAAAQLVTRPNQTTVLDAGNAVTFTCVAYGIPNPSISWKKGDTLLSNDSRVTIFADLLTEDEVTFVYSMLELCSAEERDTGQYSCFADNTIGNDTASFVLTVAVIGQDNFTIYTSPAQLVMHPNQTTALDPGNAVTFTCVAYGIPNPSISWKKGDILLSNDSQVTIYEQLMIQNGVTLVQSILELSSAEEADAGQYSCIADNTLSNDTASFELVVTQVLVTTLSSESSVGAVAGVLAVCSVIIISISIVVTLIIAARRHRAWLVLHKEESNSAAVRSRGASEIDFKGAIPMAECEAYGKLTQLTGGRGGYPVSHRFPGGVIEGQRRKEGENVYEDIEGIYETVN